MKKVMTLVALVMLLASPAACGGEEEEDMAEEPRVETDAGDVHEDCGCPE